MIQPWHWSLYSVYKRVWYNNERDAIAYCRYLQPTGKVVLDIGSGDFGTAKEFLKHGAKHVICIDVKKHPVPSDIANKATVIVAPFEPKHLDLEYDVVKLDIEGYEILALPYTNKLKRCIIEVHSEYLVDRFKEKGFRIYKRNDVAGEHCIQALMVNDR